MNAIGPAAGSAAPGWLRFDKARYAWRAGGAHQAARPVSVAIGMFDGVHLGHQAVIESAVATARRGGGLSAVLTFEPHPSRIFRPEAPTRLLMPPELKTREILALGVDLVIWKQFEAGFAALDAAAFVDSLQSALPSLRSIHVGENFRFGRGRQGDAQNLVTLAGARGVYVFSIDRIRFNGEPVSSSRLRLALEAGEIDAVNAMLGFDYYAEGPVVAGRQLGRTIGFPTLNLAWEPELRPRLGVYAVVVTGPEGRVAPAVANYGIRPTVEQTPGRPLLEVHLLEPVLSPWTTGDRLQVSWRRFLRAERKFASLQALQEQITDDRESAARFFGNASV